MGNGVAAYKLGGAVGLANHVGVHTVDAGLELKSQAVNDSAL